MAAPVFETFAVTQKDSLGSPFTVAAAKPSGTVEGDLLVAFITTDGGTGGTTITAEAGWTAITATLANGTLLFSRGFYRDVGASDGSTYDFTCSQDERIIAGLVRISGADNADPIEVEANNTDRSDTPTAPTVTPLTDNSLVLAFVGVDDGDAGDDTGFPGGAWTDRWVRTNGTANECTGGCVSQTIASQTASGTAVFTGHINEQWIGQTLAINELIAGTTFNQSLAGAMPASTGAVTMTVATAQALAGDMPSPTGDITKKAIKFNVAGDMPSSSGDTARITSISLSGVIPAQTGDVLKKTLKQLDGSMPTSTGDVAAMTVFGQLLAGAMPNPVGGILKKIGKIVGGPMPPPSGAVTKKIELNLAGDMPSSAGAITKKIFKSVDGALPSATGTVGAIVVTQQALAGSMPNPTGGITKKIGISLAGDMPAESGALTKKVFVAFAGNMPASVAALTTELNPGGPAEETQAVAGAMPAPSGILTVTMTTAQAVAGNMPNPTGGSLRKIGVSLAGNMPTPVGLATKKTTQSFSGNMPASTGLVVKKTAKAFAGSVPAPAGELDEATIIAQSNAGIMGAMSGILATVFIDGVPLRKVVKIIGASFRKFLQ